MNLFAVDYDCMTLGSIEFEMKKSQVNLNEDYENIIKKFEPEALLAEHKSENLVVLEQAVKNKISYGLFHPDIKHLDENLLAQRIPKVILLDKDSTSIEAFKKYGQVIIDLTQYENIANDLIFSLFFHMDIECD